MKKILVLSLVLALALTLVMPSAAMAAKPVSTSVPTSFSAQGVMLSIDTGNVKALGNSGKWLVRDRHIEGRFVSGDLGDSPFTITYGGIFDLATQEGKLAGKLAAGSNSIGIIGAVAPLSMFDIGTPESPMYLPKLTITGKWAGLKDLNANGSFEAWMVFVPTADGHVDYIVASSFAMKGKFVKDRSDKNLKTFEKEFDNEWGKYSNNR